MTEPTRCIYEQRMLDRGYSAQVAAAERCTTGDIDPCSFCKQKMSDAADQAFDDMVRERGY